MVQIKSVLLVLLLLVGSLTGITGGALAVNPDEVLDDPVLETRARQLSTHLRCLVCQNQSIDDSDAGLAKDLRVLVRERLVAGDTDDEVINFLVARYGEFVLLKPTFGGHTLILWLGGPAILLIALGIIGWTIMTRKKQAVSSAPALSRKEEERLNALLDDLE